jgi:hypothetical protein
VSFLPIVARELGTAARKPSTYRARTGFVIVTSLIAGLLLLVEGAGWARQMGNAVFPVLTTLAFIYCLLAGARQAADCLSEEKREGTLGLIFLTDLRGHDVVLGKLVSVSARAFQGLCAIFPVLSIGLLLGGITGGEFWRTIAVLVNALFFSLALGLCVSSLTREAHVALATTILALAFTVLAPLGIEWSLSRIWPACDLFGWVSPAAAGLLASDLAYQAHSTRFWGALSGNHTLGWLLLIMASICLPRSWQERSTPKHSWVRPESRLPEVRRLQAANRAALRVRLLEINPIYWLAARNERERLLLHTFVPLVAVCGVGLFLLSRFLGGYTLGIASVLNLGVTLMLKLWVAWHACATLAEAKRNGAVELLLATPLRVEEIIYGHWQALQRFFLWPTIAALALPVAPALEALVRQPPTGSSLLFLPVPAMTVFGMATFVLDLVALAWVGMWMGLSHTKNIQAFGKTVLFVVIVPTVVFCFPNILFDLFWITWARRKLEHEFRQAATERYAPTFQAVDDFMVGSGPAALPPVIRA